MTTVAKCEHRGLMVHTGWQLDNARSGFSAYCPDCDKHFTCEQFLPLHQEATGGPVPGGHKP